MATCQGSQSADETINPSVVIVPLQMPLLASSIHGKLGGVLNCNDANQFIDFSAMPTQDSLVSRIFDNRHKADALMKWNGILDKQYEVDTSSDRFLIITPLNTNTTDLGKATAELNKAAMFFSTYFHLSAPDKLITVFMMPDNKALQKAASTVHNISLPTSNLGYSNLSDLSLFGISDIIHVGTLYHELFHLMIKSDVGDIPVWLDEGLACLYSTYSWKDSTLLGSATWRTAILKAAQRSHDYALDFPTVSLLTRYTWGQFNGVDDQNICKASINYAIANHLMLYFQEKKILQRIVDAYHYRADVDLKDSTYYPDNVKLLENAVGEPIDSIDVHFASWLAMKYAIHEDYHPLKRLVPTFTEISNHYKTLMIAIYENAKPDSIRVLDRQVDSIRHRIDAAKSFYAVDEFYAAEEKRLQGVYDPYIKTEAYKKTKLFHDAALALELRIRKAMFN